MPLRKTLCVLIVPFTLQALPAAASDEWQLSFGGNMQYDWLRTDENDTLTQLGDVRRSRLSFRLRGPAGVEARGEYNAFANNWTDAFLRWRDGAHSVRVGQYKQPMFLDELSSDRFTMFMEQGLPGSFALARRIGAEYTWSNPQWRASLSDGNLRGQLKGSGAVGRVVYTPFAEAGNLLHLAISASRSRVRTRTARASPLASRPAASVVRASIPAR